LHEQTLTTCCARFCLRPSPPSPSCSFGYLTSTNIKIIVAVRDVLLREDKVREMFKALHKLYVDASSNPFGRADGRITSPQFEQDVARTVEASNAAVEYRGPVPY
jgi:hypothetical protein